MKFHTWNRQCLTWRVNSWGITHVDVTFGMMEKVSSNRHGFGYLEKGTNCTQVFVSQLLKIGLPMGWERISPLDIYNNFNTWNYFGLFPFWLDVVMSISRLRKSHSTFTHVCTYVKFFKLTEMGLSTLGLLPIHLKWPQIHYFGVLKPNPIVILIGKKRKLWNAHYFMAFMLDESKERHAHKR